MKRIKWIAGILTILIALSLCACSWEATEKEQQEEEPLSVDVVYATSDDKYQLTATEDWTNVLKQFKNENKDMTLMINNEMMFGAVFETSKSIYTGASSIQTLRMYADAMITVMKENNKTFRCNKLKKTEIHEMEGYYTDAYISDNDSKLGYRLCFLEGDNEYIRIVFWTDSGVYKEKKAEIEEIINTFEKRKKN